MNPDYSSTPKSHPAVPIAIIVGFALIALAIFFTGDRSTDPAPAVTSEGDPIVASGTIRPVDQTDYVRGNPNAPIVMIEYSDYDCPFCKQYHDTLNQIMNEYGVSGKVAWVYRQFPLPQLHPNAPKISEAALCVGNLGGSTAFWTFTDKVFQERAINEQTNMVKLTEYAQDAGVDMGAYQTCLGTNQMEETVKTSVEEALALGAVGTPYTVLIVGNEQAIVNGAQSYEVVKSIIDNLLGQLEGTVDTQAPTEGS
jgi:protein-disulfide isomerase